MPEERKFVTQSPENSETPLADVHGWVTPTRLFFVRNHFDVPAIERKSWRLAVGGCVARPLELTWDDLDAMPQRTLLATLECAGNGRSFLSKKAAGVPWGAGAVAHAEWSGVPLSAVLDLAGVDPETRGDRLQRRRPRQRARSSGADALRPRPAAGQGPPPRHAAGPADERRAADAQPRLSRAAARARLVRRRFRQVADAAGSCRPCPFAATFRR